MKIQNTSPLISQQQIVDMPVAKQSERKSFENELQGDVVTLSTQKTGAVLQAEGGGGYLPPRANVYIEQSHQIEGGGGYLPPASINRLDGGGGYLPPN